MYLGIPPQARSAQAGQYVDTDECEECNSSSQQQSYLPRQQQLSQAYPQAAYQAQVTQAYPQAAYQAQVPQAHPQAAYQAQAPQEHPQAGYQAQVPQAIPRAAFSHHQAQPVPGTRSQHDLNAQTAQTTPQQSQLQDLFYKVSGIDRAIDIQEFIQVVLLFNQNLRNHPQFFDIAHRLFSQMDSNRNGYISLNEFLTGFPLLKQQLGI